MILIVGNSLAVPNNEDRFSKPKNSIMKLLKECAELRKIDLPKSFSVARTALEQSKKEGDKVGIVYSLRNIGETAMLLGNSELAATLFQLAMSRAVEMKHLKAQSNILNSLGSLMLLNSDLDSAATYFYDGLRIATEIDDKSEMLMLTNNMGIVLLNQKQYSDALEYFESSNNMLIESGDSSQMGSPLCNIGIIHYNQQNYGLALDNFQKAKNIYLRNGNKFQEAVIRSNIGALLETTEDYSHAEIELTKALKLYKKLKVKSGISTTSLNLGVVYYYLEKYERSIKYCKTAVQLGEEVNNLQITSKANKFLSKNFAEMNDFEKALMHFQQYALMNDSLFTKDKDQRINELEAQFKHDSMEKKISELEAVKGMQSLRLKYYIASSAFLVVFIAIVFTLFMRRKSRVNLSVLNELRDLQQKTKDSNNHSPIINIPINIGNRIELKKLEDIAYFHSENKFVFLNLLSGKSRIVDYTISLLEQKLPSQFVRVHRSYIINRNHIKEIRKSYNGKVVFIMNEISNKQIPSSLGYSENTKSLIEI